MSNNIPDEAVEAAARVMLDKMYDDKTLKVDDEDRVIARAALEAAAPHMTASMAGWERCHKRHASQVQHLLDCEAPHAGTPGPAINS